MTTTATSAYRNLTPWEIKRAESMRALIPAAASMYHDEIAADVAQAVATWRTLPTPGPCPGYCTEPAGHGYTEDDPRSPDNSSRSHGRSFGRFDGGRDDFYVSQLEVAHPDGTVTLHAPHVLLPTDSNTPVTDERELSGIADAAAAALRLVREINFGSAVTR